MLVEDSISNSEPEYEQSHTFFAMVAAVSAPEERYFVRKTEVRLRCAIIAVGFETQKRNVMLWTKRRPAVDLREIGVDIRYRARYV